MQILLLSLNLEALQQVDCSRPPGCPCEFRSEVGGGSAWLLLNPKKPTPEAGQAVEVSLSCDSASDPQPIPPETPLDPQLCPMAEPGDFQAAGQVTSIVWLDDEGKNSVVEALVGDSRFSLFYDQTGADRDVPAEPLSYGQWVSFRIHKLLLIQI